MNEGYLYVASGPRYLFWATCSAKKLRAQMEKESENYPIALFTDVTAQFSENVFDIVEPIEEQGGRAKPASLGRSPFRKTIFLDVDTLVRKSCSSMFFDLLDDYDLLCSHAPAREGRHKNESIPCCFPEFNTGVIGFHERIRPLFQSWLERYDEMGLSADQPSFRSVVYQDKTKLYVLPEEFNCRPFRANLAPSRVWVTHNHEVHSKSEIQEAKKLITIS